MGIHENQQIYDVIISGAGPVGLFLSCELALSKCSVLILEKEENPLNTLKKMPFGMRGLNSLSIEAFYRRGLLDELQLHKQMNTPHITTTSTQNLKPLTKPQGGGHFAGIPLRPEYIDHSQWKYRLQSSTETHLLSEMEELETVLTRRAKNLGVEIKRGFTLTGFHQNEKEVHIQSKTPSGEQSFKCKWLVGCDGSRSVVRKLGGFKFIGTEPEFTGYSAKVDIVDSSMLKLGRNVTPTGMYLLSQVDYLILQDFDGGSFHHSKKPITLEHIEKILRRLSNTEVTISALHLATTWTDRSRQSTTYKNGRIFLAGDAAHIHSPLGGQGLNLGIGDAMNLGWKLAASIHSIAPEGFLESYFTERHPIGEQILDWSRAQVAIMKPDPVGRALNAVVRDFMNTRDGATYVAGRISGIGTSYNLGGEHVLVGHSVPNFEFEEGLKIGELMHDGKMILIDFYTNASLKKFTKMYGEKIKTVSKRAKEQLGLSALLIRPDGIVAWASEGESNIESMKKAVERWI